MKSVRNFNYYMFLFLLFVFTSLILCKSKKNEKQKHHQIINQIAANPVQSIISINNITTWVGDNGHHDWIVGDGSWNGEYPNGSDVGTIFSEGIVWGGKVSDGQNPLVRVNGNTYASGSVGVTRLFRVRPDYLTGDLTRDAADFFKIPINSVTASDIQELRDQYEIDWNEWPAGEGALYKDVDGDGQYTPTIDIPGIPGASQTIFIKYTDADSDSLYGSPPIGLEFSETYWAYNTTDALSNVIFKKVDIVYKGTANSAANSKIDSFYISQWADPDVGNSTDDFAGCDTTLNLGYAYNSSNLDNLYDGIIAAPPAVGYDFLQGVSQFTGNPNDSAMYNLNWRQGYKYVNDKPMSSFVFFATGDAWSDPAFDYPGTLEFYNLMRGVLPEPRYPASNPFPESVADVTPFGTFMLDGDPVIGTGKIDGIADAPGDRRILLTNGPIMNFELGDTAQVVIALVGGIGNSYLNSITQLKANDSAVQAAFDNLFKDISTDVNESNDPIIKNFELSQNYPNPFNPTTTIKYSIPLVQSGHALSVQLKIYNVLGKEIASLVNKNQSPGNYKVDFNASNLSTGVYIYQLTVGNFISSKKMILLK